MKITNSLFLGFIVSTFLSACGGGSSDTSSNSYQLSRYEVTDTLGNLLRVYTYSYNDSGNVLRRDRDDNDDSVTDAILTFEYDKDGRQIKDHHDTDANGETDALHTHVYDNNGRLSATYRDFYNDEVRVDMDIYIYDLNDRITNINVFDKDKIEIYKNEFIYDENNFVIKSLGGSTFLEIRSIYVNKVDENGRLISRTRDFDADETVDQIMNFTYVQGPCVVPEPRSILSYYCFE